MTENKYLRWLSGETRQFTGMTAPSSPNWMKPSKMALSESRPTLSWLTPRCGPTRISGKHRVLIQSPFRKVMREPNT